jgi:ABC-type Fe3+-hydroxamate transport system substrate-binding protein
MPNPLTSTPQLLDTTDHMGRDVCIPCPPRRIVSLVPSQTELLSTLGLDEEVLGITKFCVRPEAWFRSKNRIGGTKNLNLEAIAALQPDLIVGNKEENERAQIEWLAARFPVWLSDVQTLEQALTMIRQVGEICDRLPQAEQLATQILSRFGSLEFGSRRQAAAYFIWRKPWMVAGGSTFIGDMLRQAGFLNVFEQSERYPEVELAYLADARPEVVLLSSEPYPFKSSHADEIAEAYPGARILFVDGEMFSWYGSRLLEVPAYFKTLHAQL